MEIKGTVYHDKKEAGQALIETCKALNGRKEENIGKYRGFSMVLSYSSYASEFSITLQGNMEHRIALGTDIFGNVTRLDINILEKGQDYTNLKKSFVIFICTYDPFGKEKYSYTFENRCISDHKLALGDEAVKIVLNTKGTKGKASRELKQLLHFMDGMESENDYTKELEKAVTQVKESEEWRREFMLMMERDRDHIKIGKLSEKIAAVREFSQEFEGEQLAKYARTKSETVSVILNLIDEHPEWDDERIAEEMLF